MDLHSILNFDSFKEAEKITGKDYKKDEKTEIIGSLMKMHHSAIKEKILKSMNDTYYAISFEDFLNVFNENNSLFNFEIAYENEFIGEGKYKEKEIIYCNINKGIFIFVHSHNMHLNDCTIYMQIKEDKKLNYILDGSFSIRDNNVLLELNGREALFYKLLKYDLAGVDYVVPWQNDAFLFFSNYEERKNNDNVTLRKINNMNYKHRRILRPCVKALENCKR